jgi:hypothetical protein
MVEPDQTIGVQGVSGHSVAKGVGTISFTLKDDQGANHRVTLDDAIYLPESRKNLISVSRWGRDRQDDCSVTSREKYSVFVWDNGKKRRHIYHKPNCPIPIVQVNENDEAVALFASEYNLTDSLNEDAITTIKTSTTTLDHQCGDASDKQSSA